EKPLVVVGTAPYNGDYIARVRSSADARVRLLGGVWDQDLLNQLYAHSLLYLHGHSVGGTNPSLLRALGAGAPVAAFDVEFNREVLGDGGTFFDTADSVAHVVVAAELSAASREERSRASRDRARAYDWDAVTDSYEALFQRLHAEGPTRNRPTGRRATVAEW
ncbi:glycosyltransferase, partial [Georgenia sp. 10Sc9-8]|nr:glycosyltransferase [Georgenia halotolerans]